MTEAVRAHAGLLHLRLCDLQLLREPRRFTGNAFAQVSFGKNCAKTEKVKITSRTFTWNETFALDVGPSTQPTLSIQVWTTILVTKSQVGSVELCLGDLTQNVEPQDLRRKLTSKEGKEQGELRLEVSFEPGARAAAGGCNSSQFLTTTSGMEGALTREASCDSAQTAETDAFDEGDGAEVADVGSLREPSSYRLGRLNTSGEVGPLGAGLASFSMPSSPFAGLRPRSDDGATPAVSPPALLLDTQRSKSVSQAKPPVRIRERPAEAVSRSAAAVPAASPASFGGGPSAAAAAGPATPAAPAGPRPGSFTAQAFMRAGIGSGPSFSCQAASRTPSCTTAFSPPGPVRAGRPDLSIAQGCIPFTPTGSSGSLPFTPPVRAGASSGTESAHRQHSSPFPAGVHAHAPLPPACPSMPLPLSPGNSLPYQPPGRAVSGSAMCSMPLDPVRTAPSAPPLPDFALLEAGMHPHASCAPAPPAQSPAWTPPAPLRFMCDSSRAQATTTNADG